MPLENELTILMAKQERFAVDSLQTQQRFSWPPFYHGEEVTLNFFSLLPQSNAPGGRKWKIEDISTSTVKVGMGVIDQPPIAGSWVWHFGADAVTLNYNETATTLQAKINAGSAMIAAGGCTIRAEGGVFVCSFNSNGARTVTASPDNLSPPSAVGIESVQAGGASQRAILTFQLTQRPVGLGTLGNAYPAASGALTTVNTGGPNKNHQLRVKLSNRPYGGSFTVNIAGQVTDAIATSCTEQEFAAKLAALTSVGANNVSVLLEDDDQWLITFIGTKSLSNMGTCSAEFTLLSRVGKSGDIDLRTANVQLLLQGRAFINARIEFEVTPSGGTPRKYQQDIVFVNSLINPTTTGPLLYDQYLTEDESDARYQAMITDSGTLPYGGFTLYDQFNFVINDLNTSIGAKLSPDGGAENLTYAGGSLADYFQAKITDAQVLPLPYGDSTLGGALNDINGAIGGIYGTLAEKQGTISEAGYLPFSVGSEGTLYSAFSDLTANFSTCLRTDGDASGCSVTTTSGTFSLTTALSDLFARTAPIVSGYSGTVTAVDDSSVPHGLTFENGILISVS